MLTVWMRGAPLMFRVPPQWTAPAEEWLEVNAGWEPPPGWTPNPHFPPAPDGWRFWVRNRHDRAFVEYVEDVTLPGRRTRSVGVILMILGLFVFLFGTEILTALATVSLAALLAVVGVVLIGSGTSRSRSAAARAEAELRAQAVTARTDRLDQEYDIYLQWFWRNQWT